MPAASLQRRGTGTDRLLSCPTYLVAAMVVLVLLAGPSPAKGSSALPSGSSPIAEIDMGVSGDYSLAIVGRQRNVTLLAIKGLFEGFATYEVRGRVTPGGVWASFGKLGKVAVKFRPSGRVRRKHPPGRCKGRARTTVHGVFVGSIRFRGEQGYVRVRTRRAKGSMQVRPPWRCKERDPGPGGDDGPSLPDLGLSDIVALDATATRSRLAFGVSAWRPPEEHGLTLFTALSSEQRGKMTVGRTVVVSGRERTFVFDIDQGTATASPPPPFSGTAILSRGPDGTAIWSGSLRVDLPGRENASLANERFTARLYRPFKAQGAEAGLAADALGHRRRWASLLP